MFTGTGLIAFVCIFGASLAGLWLSKKLPERYLSEETHKIVQLTMSPVGLLAALVVGLLVTNAKTGLDTSRREIAQFSTSLRLLDREAVHFGSEAKPVRELLRAFTEEKIAQTWTETAASQDHSRSVRMLNEIQDRLRAFAPQDDIGREARVSGLRMIDDLKQTSRLLALQKSSHTPQFFLIVVMFWLSVLAFSYAVFAPPNAAVVVAFAVAAFSTAAAVNLIVDMDHPFAGYIKVSPAPMHEALDQMKP
jgi:hypothetical protein